MSEPMGSFPPPPPPPMPPAAGTPGPSTQAITALVLGICGIVCCGLLAPIAWYLGAAESRTIRAGLAPAQGAGIANAAKILGIIGTALLLFGIIWIFFMGGMIFLQGMMNH
jgi:hypothetical protein